MMMEVEHSSGISESSTCGFREVSVLRGLNSFPWNKTQFSSISSAEAPRIKVSSSSLAAQPSDHHLLLETLYWTSRPPPWSLVLAGSPLSWASALSGPLPSLPLHPGRQPRGLCSQYWLHVFSAACEGACLPDILTGMPHDHLTLHMFHMSLSVFLR